MAILLVAETVPVFNRGEEAIMRGMIESFKELHPSHIYYESEMPAQDEKVYGRWLEVLSIPYANGILAKVYRHLKRSLTLFALGLLWRYLSIPTVKRLATSQWRPYLECDVILSGHDNVYINTLRVLADFGLILFARLTSKRLVAYGATIGPFRGPTFLRRICAWLLNQFDLITLREHHSDRYLDEIGVCKPRREVTADLAFLMLPEQTDKTKAFLSRVEQKMSEDPIIGVSLSRSLMAYALADTAETADREREFCDLLATSLDRLLRETRARLVLINHVFGASRSDMQDDRVLHEALRNRLVALGHDVLYTGDEFSAPELKTIIGALNLLIASRTHPMIAAVSQGVPVVAFTHRRHFKTLGIIGDMIGLKSNLVTLEDLTTEGLVQSLTEALACSEHTRAALSRSIPPIVTSSRRNGRLLREIAYSLPRRG